MTLDRSPPTRRSKPRTEAQKSRRKELWLARADDRRRLEERALQARYAELKAAMTRAGLRIGTIADVAEKHADPVRRSEVLKARLERWEALWMITRRKQATRGKIIIGGAVLAEIEHIDFDAPSHRAFLDALVALLDARVPRVRDRLVVRDLLSAACGEPPPIPLRPGGPLGEPIEEALAAIGERPTAFGRGDLSAEAEDEADLVDLAELDGHEGDSDQAQGLAHS
jgi:hypothetical protein